MNIIELETKALANLIAEEIDADADQEMTIAQAVAWLIEFRYLGPSSIWPIDGQETLKRRMERLAILRPEEQERRPVVFSGNTKGMREMDFDELLREADRLDGPDFWGKLNAFCGRRLYESEYVLSDWYKNNRSLFDQFIGGLTPEERKAVADWLVEMQEDEAGLPPVDPSGEPL